ncbi:MAG: M48 family metalloprotease, partial [Nitrospirae bacterium]|nr:M48 family metalloprotease [Nitrospirota bacterium]
MPLTFIEIEKQKNWRIGIFFVVLLFIYFFITITLAGAVFLVSPLPFITSGAISSGHILQYIIVPAGFALLIASIHFWFSTYDAVNSVMHKLGASAPDPEDGIHKRLINIMEEIHVVTGNKKRIGCMVIPSLSMNAIAVADLRGNAAVLITEGLLSRLTRPQLEAVLAHEIHHIFSGDCLEATVAASLFGVYAAAMEKLQDTSDRRATFFPAFVLACILLKLSQILNMFISREREYRADAASVRMTRNPLALAEALHLLSRNWRGMGFIGNGLEMLCIVNP